MRLFGHKNLGYDINVFEFNFSFEGDSMFVGDEDIFLYKLEKSKYSKCFNRIVYSSHRKAGPLLFLL